MSIYSCRIPAVRQLPVHKLHAWRISLANSTSSEGGFCCHSFRYCAMPRQLFRRSVIISVLSSVYTSLLEHPERDVMIYMNNNRRKVMRKHMAAARENYPDFRRDLWPALSSRWLPTVSYRGPASENTSAVVPARYADQPLVISEHGRVNLASKRVNAASPALEERISTAVRMSSSAAKSSPAFFLKLLQHGRAHRLAFQLLSDGLQQTGAAPVRFFRAWLPAPRPAADFSEIDQRGGKR